MKQFQLIKLNSLLSISVLIVLFSCSSLTINMVMGQPNATETKKVTQFKNQWKDYSQTEIKGIREFVIDEYLKEIEGDNYKSMLTGKPVYSNEATTFTQYYYSQFGLPSTTSNPNILRDTTVKSIYFTASEIVDFLRTIETSCSGGVLGLRFYLAKYPANYSIHELRDQTTIILRGVCDNEDLLHTATEQGTGLRVARNYGDACPPLCDQNNPNLKCKGGEYRANGAFIKVCH